ECVQYPPQPAAPGYAGTCRRRRLHRWRSRCRSTGAASREGRAVPVAAVPDPIGRVNHTKGTTMARTILQKVLAIGCVMSCASVASAAFPVSPVGRCGPDAVVAGTVCLDRYEATVWRVPNPSTANAVLVRKIQQGFATRADLVAGGATQLGLIS